MQVVSGGSRYLLITMESNMWWKSGFLKEFFVIKHIFLKTKYNDLGELLLLPFKGGFVVIFM